MLLVTPLDADRPLYVCIQDVTAVAGPVHEINPVSPGKNSEHWVVEIFMRDQKVHTVRFSNKQQADTAVRGIVPRHTAVC